MASWLFGNGGSNVTVAASSSKAAFQPGDGKHIADLMDRVSKRFARLPSETELFEQNAQKLANLKSHLQDARDIQRALTSLSAVLKTTIPSLEKLFSEIFVQEHYAKLPDEIFAIIFEFAGVDDFRTTKRISHVCRRFRLLSLSISRLWTIICPKSRCQLIDAITIAERSQRVSSGLNLQLKSSNIRPWSGCDIDYTLSLMDFVRLHSSRIRHLTLDLAIVRRDVDFTAYSRLDFPELESLKIILPLGRRNEPPGLFNHIYVAWRLPSLRNLHCVNTFPHLPEFRFYWITTFHFEMERCTHPSQIQLGWTLSGLSQFLRLFKYLTSLTLDIDCETSHFTSLIEDPYVPTTNLQKLSFKLQSYDFVNAKTLFWMFDYDSVVSLSIEVCSDILPYLPFLFMDVWRKDRLHELRKLDFKIIPRTHSYQFKYPDYSPTSPRTLILQHFLGGNGSAMQSVYLESAVDDEFRLFRSSNRLAALQLKNCQLLSRDWEDEEGAGPDIIYDLDSFLKEGWEETNERLILDGEKDSPLDDAQVERITI